MREENLSKKLQAFIVVSKKILTLSHALAKKKARFGESIRSCPQEAVKSGCLRINPSAQRDNNKAQDCLVPLSIKQNEGMSGRKTQRELVG